MRDIFRSYRIKTSCYLLIAVLFFVSCKVSESYYHPAGITDVSLYRDAHSTDSVSMAAVPWKEMFSDTLLQKLIQEGIDNNLDLKIAMSRIKEAQANYQQGKAALYPALTLNANFPLSYSGNLVSPSALFQLYGSASWEVDLWGKLKSSKKASMAALLQSEAYKRAVQTQLVSDIATNYTTLLALDAQLEVTLKTVENRALDVEIMKKLKESDVVTGAAVVQSEANRYSVEVTIPDLRQNIRAIENALSILLGRSPGSITRGSLTNQHAWTNLQTGVPAQLLSNRPDVMVAEYQLHYYFELTKAARTYFYPSLTITAQGGWANGSVSQLFSASSLFGNVVGGLIQPVFNHGLNKALQKLRKKNRSIHLKKRY